MSEFLISYAAHQVTMNPKDSGREKLQNWTEINRRLSTEISQTQEVNRTINVLSKDIDRYTWELNSTSGSKHNRTKIETFNHHQSIKTGVQKQKRFEAKEYSD